MDFGNLYSLIANGKTGAKRTNPGISTTDVAEETYEPRHRYSRLGIGIADIAEEIN